MYNVKIFTYLKNIKLNQLLEIDLDRFTSLFAAYGTNTSWLFVKYGLYTDV